jgi:hypothetical protein
MREFGWPLTLVACVVCGLLGYWLPKLDTVGNKEILHEIICVGALVALSIVLFWGQIILPFVPCFLSWYLVLRTTYFRRHQPVHGGEPHGQKSPGHQSHRRERHRRQPHRHKAGD